LLAGGIVDLRLKPGADAQGISSVASGPTKTGNPSRAAGFGFTEAFNNLISFVV
jgi:hypothetical protein